MKIELSQCIITELQTRSWSQSELARRAKVSQTTISNLINEKRGVSDLSFRAIAEAFKVPRETLYRLGDILAEASTPTTQTEQLLFMFEQMDDRDRQSFLI